MAAIAALVLGFFATIAVAADNVAPTKAELEEMYNAAYRAFDAKKFSEALKQLDAIDARQPDLAASKNLRGVILMRQAKYDEAETALQEAARIDPKFWNARFNLAEIPFLKKDWAEARKRFEQLLASGGSDLAKEASQLIQYKILLTYLQEGNGNMVDSMLAKLELSPDTPAIDYVKAAVALQAKNQSEAKDWISAAARSIVNREVALLCGIARATSQNRRGGRSQGRALHSQALRRALIVFHGVAGGVNDHHTQAAGGADHMVHPGRHGSHPLRR